MNAMQGASAALAIGLPERAVVRGLRSFVMDPDRNPGRANLFELDGRIVVLDYAHNEAGMARAHRDLQRPLCGPAPRSGSRSARPATGPTRSCTTSRTGRRAAADHVVIAELHRYLRGREPLDIIERLTAGAREGGATEVDVYTDELAAVRGVSRPVGARRRHRRHRARHAAGAVRVAGGGGREAAHARAGQAVGPPRTRRPGCPCDEPALESEALLGEPRALDPGADLLERDVARGRRVVGERREAAVVRRAEPVRREGTSAASRTRSRTSSGDSTRGSIGSVTPTKIALLGAQVLGDDARARGRGRARPRARRRRCPTFSRNRSGSSSA